MRKTKQTFKLQKRDWAIAILALAVLAVGWYAYQVDQARLLGEKAGGDSWINHQIQINKLKACIDEGIKPCDITTKAQQ
jgi:hypothetical protein